MAPERWFNAWATAEQRYARAVCWSLTDGDVAQAGVDLDRWKRCVERVFDATARLDVRDAAKA